MSTSALDTSLRAFFERFETRGDTEPLAGADLFHEQFLSLDPGNVAFVGREQLRSALPMRAQMFGSIGATGSRLRDLAAHAIDDQHVLVATTWDLEFEDESAEPLTLHASYLLRRAADGWSVVVYLNHQDIGSLLAHRRGSVEA